MSEIQNYNFCKKALSLEEELRKGFIFLAEFLYKIKTERMFEPSWETFEDYLLEFKDISPATASKLIKVYEKFVIEFSLSPVKVSSVGYSLLYEIIPVVKTQKDLDKWFHRAEVLSRSDLSKSVKEKKTGVDMANCKHDFYYLKICRICGDKIRIYERDLPSLS